MTTAIDTWQEVPKSLLGKNGEDYPSTWKIEIQCPRLNSVRKWNGIDPNDMLQQKKHIIEIVRENTRIIDTSNNTEIDVQNLYEYDDMALLFMIFDKFNTENKKEHNVFTTGQCPNPACKEHYPKLIVGPQNFRYKIPAEKYNALFDDSIGAYVLKTKDFGDITFKNSTLGLGQRVSEWVQTLEPNFIKENMDVILTIQAMCSDFTMVDNKYLRNLQIAEYNLMPEAKKIFFLNIINELTVSIEGALSYTCAKCDEPFRSRIPFGSIDKSMFVDVQSFDGQLF